VLGKQKKGGNEAVEEKKSNHGPSSHFLMMILCCAIPIIAIVVLSSMGILGSWGFYLLMLLCPLLHFLLMRKMGSHHEKTAAPLKGAE
jgi:hypothetical protein